MKKNKIIYLVFLLSLSAYAQNNVSTVALWTFDEQIGIYPSCVLSDVSGNDHPLVLGPGGEIVEGKYGNSLQASEQDPIKLPKSKSVLFGMVKLPISDGRAVEPLTWHNANFAALMTSGENHLRKEFKFAEVTKTKLNIGKFDWTIEFWFYPENDSDQEGVIFEIGEGPRGENNRITKLSISENYNSFHLFNYPESKEYEIRTELTQKTWQHVAFVYDESETELRHYIDGRLISINDSVIVSSLIEGEEDYMSISRSGNWGKPLNGRIDELRFSTGKVYLSQFNPPSTFSDMIVKSSKSIELKEGLPLLKEMIAGDEGFIDLGERKHLFIDDILLDRYEGAKFVVNSPKMAECVIDNIEGSFRKHLNIVEDETGLLRMYNAVDDDYLAVRTSKDGIVWDVPDLPNGKYKGKTNIVVHDPTGMGIVFIDPNGPADERWKYLTGYNDQGIFIYTSPDGYNFNRVKTAMIPCWPGSQSNIFYDEQQQKYIAYHRADFARGVGKATQREFVYTETQNVTKPWPFRPATQKEGLELAERKRVKDLLPFYLDNGPLTPGGFGHEYPVAFGPLDDYDPIDTDIYVPKAIKYPWAPDTYLAFPIVYFHYKKSSPVTRSILFDEIYRRGSGPLETQLSVSRDGKNWDTRYPRPAYVGNGMHAGKNVNTAYMAHGMVRRGNEIWQYYFGESQYHSAHTNEPEGRGVYRLVQRFDGFVSLDSPYDKEIYIVSKPIKFEGDQLLLNIDTDAAGYAQVGFIDVNDNPIKGFALDDCIYINGDFISTEVEWMKNRDEIKKISSSHEEDTKTSSDDVIVSSDISELQGRMLKLIFRMRGSKLYSMEFKSKN